MVGIAVSKDNDVLHALVGGKGPHSIHRQGIPRPCQSDSPGGLLLFTLISANLRQ